MKSMTENDMETEQRLNLDAEENGDPKMWL